jgi:hypothetical protein
MDGKFRRKVEMGKRVLIFCREHLDPNGGSAKTVARLEQNVRRGEHLFGQQMDGRNQVATAAERKRDLRRIMKLVHLPHLMAAAEAASMELPELIFKFKIPRSERAFSSFLTAARAIESVALERRELLERHGMADEVLEDFRKSLGEYERAMRDLVGGRLIHVAARADLERISREIDRAVKLLDGFCRVCLARQPDALAAWESAKKITKEAGSPPADSDAA